MSQVGQRRGKIGVKGAKNFHLLMKGKITHLAVAVCLAGGGAWLLLGLLLNALVVLGLNRTVIHIWGADLTSTFSGCVLEPGQR